jgi:hypothetical protein
MSYTGTMGTASPWNPPGAPAFAIDTRCWQTSDAAVLESAKVSLKTFPRSIRTAVAYPVDTGHPPVGLALSERMTHQTTSGARGVSVP